VVTTCGHSTAQPYGRIVPLGSAEARTLCV